MTTLEHLNRLAKFLTQENLPKSVRSWRGAGVVIQEIEPLRIESEDRGFYPPPRLVVTKHCAERSRLFFNIRDAFKDRVNHVIKKDFYGRLANVANRYLNASTKTSAHLLCAAVLHEAWAIYDEMERGEFCYSPIAFGGSIFDDSITTRDSGFIDIETTIAFFENRGIEIFNISK